MPVSLSAQTHVVSPAELHREMAAVSSERANNLSALTHIFASPGMDKALGAMGLDPV